MMKNVKKEVNMKPKLNEMKKLISSRVYDDFLMAIGKEPKGYGWVKKKSL